MSDVPRFDCFDDGMREGYNESWVRSSDYDALRAERDALGWARVELANIVHAKRFNKLYFSDDTEFADWAQSRARHQLVAIDAALAGKP